MTSIYYHSHGRIRGSNGFSITVPLAVLVRNKWTVELFNARAAGDREHAELLAHLIKHMDAAIPPITEDVDHDLFAQTIGGQL